jgi:hypothetical protein
MKSANRNSWIADHYEDHKSIFQTPELSLDSVVAKTATTCAKNAQVGRS